MYSVDIVDVVGDSIEQIGLAEFNHFGNALEYAIKDVLPRNFDISNKKKDISREISVKMKINLFGGYEVTINVNGLIITVKTVFAHDYIERLCEEKSPDSPYVFTEKEIYKVIYKTDHTNFDSEFYSSFESALNTVLLNYVIDISRLEFIHDKDDNVIGIEFPDADEGVKDPYIIRIEKINPKDNK